MASFRNIRLCVNPLPLPSVAGREIQSSVRPCGSSSQRSPYYHSAFTGMPSGAIWRRVYVTTSLAYSMLNWRNRLRKTQMHSHTTRSNVRSRNKSCRLTLFSIPSHRLTLVMCRLESWHLSCCHLVSFHILFTRSRHLSFGLPRILIPSIVIYNAGPMTSYLSRLCTCQTPLDLFSLRNSAIGCVSHSGCLRFSHDLVLSVLFSTATWAFQMCAISSRFYKLSSILPRTSYCTLYLSICLVCSYHTLLKLYPSILNMQFV